jgi:hypothetical protein
MLYGKFNKKWIHFLIAENITSFYQIAVNIPDPFRSRFDNLRSN